jgi:hypothetical protein
MKKLYQYTVVFHKYGFNESGLKIYIDSELIIEPRYVLAVDEKDVIFKATREVGEQYAQAPDNVEILIKKF